MDIHYSKQAEKFLKKQISNKYNPVTWDDIEEVEPDEIDLMMLKAIENDLDCHEFVSENDINWD